MPVSVVPRAKTTVMALHPEPFVRSFCVSEVARFVPRGLRTATGVPKARGNPRGSSKRLEYMIEGGSFVFWDELCLYLAGVANTILKIIGQRVCHLKISQPTSHLDNWQLVTCFNSPIQILHMISSLQYALLAR